MIKLKLKNDVSDCRRMRNRGIYREKSRRGGRRKPYEKEVRLL